jgi:hypothetical protein
MGASDESDSDTTRGLHGFALTATVLVTSFVITLCAALDVGGLRARLEGYLDLWPQHWTFFVDLNRDLLVGYRVNPGSPRLDPLSERQHWGSWSWGLSRAGYAEGVELREVGRRIPDKYWYSCNEAVPADCGKVLSTAQVYRAKNSASEPLLCGPVAIAVERTQTPADRQLPTQPRQVYRIAFADLDCQR